MNQIDAIKLALEALKSYQMNEFSGYEISKNYTYIIDDAIIEIEKVLAQTQEPDYWLGFGLLAHTEKPFENATPLYTAPPQRTEKKMVMWPCLIDTADFSKGTVTVVMQCEDYKVSAGTHWLSASPPKEENNDNN